jgi:hypothetical protein
MKVCFRHEQFDSDVSSGTDHALYQWVNLCIAFGVSEIAIINTSEDTIPVITPDLTVHKYSTFEDFTSEFGHENLTYVEMGGDPYHTFDYSTTEWLVFGGTAGLPHAHVGIDTGLIGLFPREAAAIILAATKWQ